MNKLQVLLTGLSRLALSVFFLGFLAAAASSSANAILPYIFACSSVSTIAKHYPLIAEGGARVYRERMLSGNAGAEQKPSACAYREQRQRSNEPLSKKHPEKEEPKNIYKADPIVVTASRIPSVFSRATRNVLVIPCDASAHPLAATLQDLLEYASGVDSRRRGPYGVQADVSIRGGSFEQTLLLIYGIKISDPQTGHHNLDLPLQLDDVERVEILKGHGSRLYGPNAFGGVINIITRNRDKKDVSFRATTGEHDLANAALALSYPFGISKNQISISRSKSSGYRHNTDFNIWKGRWSSHIKLGSLQASTAIGYLDKEFGANGFYSELFPNQWEHTRTTFLDGGTNLQKDRLSFSSKIFWRHHTDEFVLDRKKPEWYRNNHTTDTYGIEFQQSFLSRLGSIAFGGEAGIDAIESSNLGEHRRNKGGIFIECQPGLGKRTKLTLRAFAYYYSDWGWETWPGVDFGYQLRKRSHLYASIGRSFRVSTYTELYYISPVNKGNSRLRPEETWSYEVGFKWRPEHLIGNLNIFRREGHNLIDWVRTGASVPWEARNITTINTTGIETRFAFDPPNLLKYSPIPRIEIGYTYIDSDKETENFESKYVLDHLKHQLICNFESPYFFKFRQDLQLRYEERAGGENHLLLDARLSRRFTYGKLFIKDTNLFDVDYAEIGGVPMPGRWFIAGVRVGSAEKSVFCFRKS